MFLGVSGGEPYLRSDFVEAVLAMSKNMKLLKQISVSTNGSLTDKIVKDTARLLDSTSAIVNVTVSMDGLEEEHDRVRGREGFFKAVIRTIKELKELQKRYDRLEIGIRHTMLPDNYKEIPKLYALSRELGINFTTKPATDGGLYKNEKGYRMWKDNFTEEQLNDAIRTLRDVIEQERQNLELSNRTFFGKVKRVANMLFLEYSIRFIRNPDRNVFPCYAAFSSVFLDNEGNVKTCPVLYGDLGNIRERPFNEIWLGDRAKKFRKFIKKDSCACFTNCNQIPSLVLSEMPKILSIIAKERK